jgi:hypothetical protein
MCVYLDAAGDGINPGEGATGGGVDPDSDQNQCQQTGGIFVNEANGPQGDLTINIDPNSNMVLLDTDTNGDGPGSGALYETMGVPGQLDTLPTTNIMDLPNGGYPFNSANWTVGYSAWGAFLSCLWDKSAISLKGLTDTALCGFKTPGFLPADPSQ